MQLVFISPRLALQKGDFLGSGVPYWPIELATLAAFARERGDVIEFLDLFGKDPERLQDAGDHYLQGEAIDCHIGREALRQAEAFLLFAISYMSHGDLLAITRVLHAAYPSKPVAILENGQAVTAYALPRMATSFFEAGASALICGEAYHNWEQVKRAITDLEATAPNVLKSGHVREPVRMQHRGFRYPVPAWELVDREGYWRLPYSHGPKTRTYLPMLTSRGCPYPCDFCVVPETSERFWRGNAPADVVDEMLALRQRFGVRDFQIEDLNPTVQHQRWESICSILLERQADLRFYFVSGTKAETVRLDKIPLFAEAGCRYLSISPESGSRDLMKRIGKRFDYAHGLALVEACRRHGIRTQACFLVGHPAESAADFQASRDYLRDLVRAGLDEVGVFVVAPFAGSELYRNAAIDIQDRDALPSFSPKGRADYGEVQRRRRVLIASFFAWKLMRGGSIWMQGLRAVFGTPQTKMENLPRRVVFILGRIARRTRVLTPRTE